MERAKERKSEQGKKERQKLRRRGAILRERRRKKKKIDRERYRHIELYIDKGTYREK